jgi:ATP-dependent Clp protease ATP-binding subunit ClpA
MTPNPDIEKIVEQAIQLAKKRQNAYITVEHVLLALGKIWYQLHSITIGY